MGQAGDLDLLVFGEVEKEIHLADRFAEKLVSWILRHLEDDVRTIDRVHAPQGVAAENGISLSPPASESCFGHIGNQIVHAAEHATGGMADFRGPGGIADHRFKWNDGPRVGHGLQRSNEVVKFVVGQLAALETVQQSGRPTAVGFFRNISVGDHRGIRAVSR